MTTLAATAIYSGNEAFSTCAKIKDVNQVKCWGSNAGDSLGSEIVYLGTWGGYDEGYTADSIGDFMPFVYLDSTTSTSVISISSGYSFSCAILSTNVTKCFGGNPNGQLGLGNVADTADTSPGGTTFGASLPAVQLGTNKYAVSITLGHQHSCALLNDASIKCWGDNAYGQLGLGVSSSNVGTGSTDMGDNLPTVNLGSGITASAVACGGQHTCAIVLPGNGVKCWGLGNAYQLGTGTTASVGTQSTGMGDNLPNVPLGTGYTALSLSLGGDYTCVLLSPVNQLKCWGDNGEGQLGQGNANAYLSGSMESVGDNLPVINLGTSISVKSFSCGGVHVCAVLSTSAVKCKSSSLERKRMF
jgi:alpha-tubulin suppressor-like RCC1 family protein